MQYRNTAISFGCTKEAALYFDYVFPVLLNLEMIWNSEGLEEIPESFTDGLFPDEIRNDNNFSDKLCTVNNKILCLVLKIGFEELGLPSTIKSWIEGIEKDYHLIEESAAYAYNEFLEEFGITDAPLIVGGSTIEDSSDLNTDVAVAIGTLRLIDSSQASWQQVAEFRNDPEARGKLRNLRLFAAENYAGKSKAYIEDDLLRRIDDYEEQVRRWGFETKQSVLTMMLTSKFLAGALGGSLISTLFGAPTTAVASAVGGALIEIGRVSLEVSRRRFLLRNALRDNPISYIVDAKTKLGTTVQE